MLTAPWFVQPVPPYRTVVQLAERLLCVGLCAVTSAAVRPNLPTSFVSFCLPAQASLPEALLRLLQSGPEHLPLIAQVIKSLQACYTRQQRLLVTLQETYLLEDAADVEVWRRCTARPR
jgi:hypothetical protein